MKLTDLFLWIALWGAEWVLWVLVVLSLISITVMIERWFYFRRHRDPNGLEGGELESALRAVDFPRAFELVRESQAIECVVVKAGLQAFNRGPSAIAESMASAKARERLKLEALLPILGTLGNNAPFVGLLGTVLGIIKASHDMATAQGTQQTAANAVMGGVFEALVATAVGLFVAIPAVVAFNIFQRRVRAKVGRADVLAHLLLSVVPAGPTPAARPPKVPAVSDGQ